VTNRARDEAPSPRCSGVPMTSSEAFLDCRTKMGPASPRANWINQSGRGSISSNTAVMLAQQSASTSSKDRAAPPQCLALGCAPRTANTARARRQRQTRPARIIRSPAQSGTGRSRFVEANNNSIAADVQAPHSVT